MQRNITAILLLRSEDIRIFRSTGSLSDNLRGRLVREGKTEHYKEILDDVARQSSVCERRADEAERESDKLKKAEYMSYHLGEEFEGIISGVTGWGFMWNFRIPWKDWFISIHYEMTIMYLTRMHMNCGET